VPIRFFAEGVPYHFLGVFPATRHLIGVDGGGEAAQAIFLLGTDVQGRDLWSRLMYGTRISLTIGLFGVTLSLVLGVILGGLSGFYGGVADTVIQRRIEILRSIPRSRCGWGWPAAMPREWTILQVYFAITIIISLLGWTELRARGARALSGHARGRLRGVGAPGRLHADAHDLVHMVPSFMSHIIAATTLALPAMIISETALKLPRAGLCVRRPSAGACCCSRPQNVQTVAISPWLMLPAVP